MELKPYFSPLIKWWWLALLTVALALGTSYYFASNQPPVYHAKTTLLIGQTLYNPNPSGNEFFLSQQLAGLYADIAQQNIVREAVKRELGIAYLPRYEVLGLPSGQLLEIDVADTNPDLAYRVANELANQLINVSPSSLDPEDARQAEFINEQLLALRNSIITTQQQIADTQEVLGSLTSAQEIATTQAELDALSEKLFTLQTTYATMASSVPKDQSNVLSVVEPAAKPTQPSGISPLVIMAGSALFALLLSAVAAYALEAIDDRLRTTKDVEREVGLPVLGYIAEMGGQPKGVPFVMAQPRSMISESFRNLRANLETPADGGASLRSILVTSPDPSDGKTSVAVNLAMVFAQSGKRVILLDTDMRKPTVHEQLELNNTAGLAEILHGDLSIKKAIRPYGDGTLGVVTAGNLKNGVSEKINASRMDEILDFLLESAEIVILDGPPMFLADSLLWATRAEGVLMILRPGHTRKETAREQTMQFQRLHANMLGVVLNRVRPNMSNRYGQYRSHYAYYYGDISKNRKKPFITNPGSSREPEAPSQGVANSGN